MTAPHERRSLAPSSRRSVVRGAVWSVPVIAGAAAAPALAASPTCDYTPRVLNGFAVQTNNLSGASRWTNSTTLSHSLGPATGVPAFGISSANTLTYVVQAYSLSVTYPFDITFAAAPTGYTITRVKNGTSPNATYTFTFTALASVLGGTYTSTTANPPTAGFVVPTFTGTTSNAQAKADGYVANNSAGNTPVPITINRSATYQLVAPPTPCPTTPQTFPNTVSTSLTPAT